MGNSYAVRSLLAAARTGAPAGARGQRAGGQPGQAGPMGPSLQAGAAASAVVSPALLASRKWIVFGCDLEFTVSRELAKRDTECSVSSAPQAVCTPHMCGAYARSARCGVMRITLQRTTVRHASAILITTQTMLLPAVSHAQAILMCWLADTPLPAPCTLLAAPGKAGWQLRLQGSCV